ncbi:hypothetical protein B0A48_01590 [Cryoendolithus antarcticus]|uniref:PHD-type domain-containing protein n=1 Tax=Cryoendolithus antarcticus TaxID=1507870 RepID=A0A1V8TQ81_9PEZI|nr:hypothetical protein B0A48_01590 [Cryoendolithus antarcticus]
MTADPSNPPRRTTTSGRAIRPTANRPTNYYARNYGPSAETPPNLPLDPTTAAGFFPALAYFTDAITALPKEVMRQFTLMREVEAKTFGPAERLGELAETCMTFPVPARGEGAQGAGMMSFTAGNSVIGSANVSLVNGVAPYRLESQHSAPGSVIGEDIAMAESEEDLTRRRQFHELRIVAGGLLGNLDEKNVVLAEAKRVLNQQLMRLDSVMPHVEAEIPEEARLGSMTHWAYSDNRQKSKPLPPAAAERNRREIAATNSLAAAANAVHESEIAAVRREAGREAAKEKHKGRSREQQDSEFEERPKKTVGKGAKGKGVLGLGISTNGEPVKRRKLEKGIFPPAMERQISSTGKGKAAREVPRSTPLGEGVKKHKAKAAGPTTLPAKRKGITNAHASPALASSPLQGSFATATMDPPSTRPASNRMRTNSTTTLRQTLNADDGIPEPSAPHQNGTKHSTRKRPRETGDEVVPEFDPPKLRQEATEPARPPVSRSNSSKNASKPGTPRAETSDTGVQMSRTRSTRSLRNNNAAAASPSIEPSVPRMGHVRSSHGGSMSGLMRQIAPFNKSPDMNRGAEGEELDSGSDGERFGRPSNEGSRPGTARRKESEANGEIQGGDEDTDMPYTTNDLDIVSTREDAGRGGEAAAPMKATRPASARVSDGAQSPAPLSTPSASPSPAPPLQPSTAADPDLDSLASSSAPPTPQMQLRPPQQPAPDSSPEPDEAPPTDDEDAASLSPDPDDPSEPKYCYCQRGSYGAMVGCDNPKCEREWFHLGCTDLERMPGEEESWYCEGCRPRGTGNGARGRGRGGRGG